MDFIKYTQMVLCLKFYLGQLLGDHYPIEIVKHIVMMLYKPIKISCGCHHMGILIDENIYIWSEEYMSNSRRITQQFVLKSIKTIKCGFDNMMILDYNGEVHYWEKNIGKQELRIFPSIPIIKKIYMADSKKYVATEKELFFIDGSDKLFRLPIIMQVKKIKFGESHTILLTKNGSLFSCGSNTFGQLGLGSAMINENGYQKITTITDIINFDCGKLHTVTLTKNNKIYVWGNNLFGQLGLGDKTNRFSPQEILSLTKVDIVAVRCGEAHTIILAKNDQIYACGHNRCGQLGLGHAVTVYYPQKISFMILNITKIYCGADHTCALTALGKIYIWGRNSDYSTQNTRLINQNCLLMPTELKF